jgi:hypothetical protein
VEVLRAPARPAILLFSVASAGAVDASACAAHIIALTP